MSKFDSCLTSLNLRDSVPVDALRSIAADYQAGGMAPAAAMQRAVEDQIQLAEMEEASIIATVRQQYEAAGGRPRPAPAPQAQPAPAAVAQPKPLDHGELNIPNRTKNIDRDLDRYKAEQAKEAKAATKTAAQQKRADKARARALFDEVGEAIIAKNGPRFGEKELRNELEQMVKWEAPKFIKLAEKFKQEQATQPAEPKAAPLKEAPAPMQEEQEGYTLPDDIYKDWAGSAREDFKPTPRQQMVMDSAARAKDAGLFYTDEVQAFVEKDLNISAELRARKELGTEGGDVGYDIYHAGKAVDEQRGNAEVRRVEKEMVLKVGDKIGTLIFNDFKVNTGVTVEAVNDTTISLSGKRGAYGVKMDASVTNIKYAVERAYEKGKRKDNYPDFIAARAAPAAEAKPKAPALEARDKKIARKDIESTGQGMLAMAKEYKTAAHKRVKELRQQIKDNPLGNSHLRLELIKAESRWKEYQQMERDANRKIDEDAERLGLNVTGKDDLRASISDQRTIEVDGVRRPIRNSAGELVAPDFDGQVAFWQQYADGPVDARGRPIVEPGEADVRAAGEAATSPMDTQIANAIRDGINTDALLAMIESGSASKDHRALATALRQQQLKTGLLFERGQGAYASGSAETANASYRRSSDTAYLHQVAGAEQSILHELVHAASLRALERGGLAARGIRELHGHVKGMDSFKGMYGITDPEEFVAEAMTNQRFRQQLADTPAPGAPKRSLWQKLVGLVRMALGLAPSSDNVLARVMELAPDLMAENQARGPLPGQAEQGADARGNAVWNTKAFREWFGSSKVTNEQGQPVVLYHGSGSGEISEFKVDGPGQFYGPGAYFTQSQKMANHYAEQAGNRRGGSDPVIYPVYLSIKNPLDINDLMDRARWETQIKDGGLSGAIAWAKLAYSKSRADGIIIRDADGSITEAVAFRPEQVKSATGNNGNFDRNNADIRASMPDRLEGSLRNGIQEATLADIPKKIGNRLKDFRNIGLQFLGRRQLVDLYASDFAPAGKQSLLTRYSDLVQQMDADKNESGAEADDIADRWGKFKDGDKLAELMHDSTLAQIDPGKDHVAGDNKAEWSALRRRFDALDPEGQSLYKEARDAYMKHWNQVRTEIRDRIARAMPESPRRAALLEKMDATFYEKVKGVYFPLARFGNYVVTVNNAAGERQSVNFAETMNEAEALRKELVKQFPAADGHVVSKITKKKEFNAGRDAVSRGFMQELFGVLDQYEGSAELQDDINQLYLASMPDLSWTKHGIHRKGTPGFSQDARRAFAQNMFHGARYLAKLRYGDRLADFLDEMQDHVDTKATDAGYDSVRAQQVVDEMNKRHDAYMNPQGNELSNTLTSVGFLFYLGLSPASAAVNLSQTPLVTLPMLSAKYGFGKASAALLEASRQAAGNGNDISKVLTGDELAAYKEAVAAGVIDVSMAHDLAGIAAGNDTKAQGKLRPVMKWASFLFHHGEKFNRQASLLAAYRLARGAGMDHAAGYKSAVEEVYASHFDYAASNRPRFMQGNVARVVFLFKQYAQNMIYTLSRNAVKAAKGDKVALRTISGLLLSHAMAAGVLGLPLVSTLLAAASLIGGDDDEPWDAKIALRNLIADLIGQKPAEVMMRGFSRLTPFDISGRVGLDKLILPDIQEGLEGARAAESWMTAALGPVAGIGVSATKGLGKIAEGQYLRGLEDMLPVSLRNPVKALRFARDGVQDKSGIPILDDTTAMEEIGQMIGFSPSRSREAMEGKGAVYQAERRLNDRRQALIEQWGNARRAGDAEGEKEIREHIEKFNEKNESRRIKPAQLMQSLRRRQQRINEAEGGIYLPKKHQDVRDLGRFAEQDE